MPVGETTTSIPITKVGRPLKFQNPEVLAAKIQDYFNICDAGEPRTVVSKRGELIQTTEPIPYTWEGLAVHLDCSSSMLRKIEISSPFFPTISRARERIHANWLKFGLSDRYNAKIVTLCIQAADPEYRINQDNTLNVQISFEDSLSKMISERRGQVPGVAAAPCLSPPPDDPDVVDI